MSKHNEVIKKAVFDALAVALHGAYDCNRVWSAWSCGTMSEEDFSRLSDDGDRLADMADAVLDAILGAASGVSTVGDERAERAAFNVAYEGLCDRPITIREIAWRMWQTAAGTRPSRHPDDIAVDRFAVAMKAKLAKKRAEGRGGWSDKSQCTAEFLSQLLRGHVEKGDPVDVGNLAMMLHQRGEAITPTAVAPDFPAGAIVNGRTLADRLEAYPFQSDGGDLRLCADWVEFRRCFEYLAEWAGRPAPAAGDAQVLAALKQAHMALIGFMPQHRNAVIVNAIVAAREAIDAALAAQRNGDA